MVLFAVLAEGHLAVFAEHALFGVLRVRGAAQVLGAAQKLAESRDLCAPLLEVVRLAQFHASAQVVVAPEVLVPAQELV